MRKNLTKAALGAIALACATLSVHAQNAADQVTVDVDLITTRVGATKVQPEWLRLSNSASVWPGVYRWYFNTDNFPTGPLANGLPGLAEAMTVDGVIGYVKLAMSRWSQMCNIDFQYQGLTSAPVGSNDGINVVGFASFNRIAPSVPTASGAAFPFYSGNQLVDADIGINIDNRTGYWDQRGLDGLLMHEIGHAIGLAHSDVSTSIMFSNPINGTQYMQKIRGDDVAGCTALYGAAPNQLTNRTLNWAEQMYPNDLNNGYNSPQTQNGYGYVFRYYSVSKPYVGTKDGRAYMMGTDGVIRELGSLSDYTAQVQAAGY